MENRQQKLGNIFIDSSFIFALKKEIINIKKNFSLIQTKEEKSVNELIEFLTKDKYSNLIIDSNVISKNDFVRVFFDNKDDVETMMPNEDITVSDEPFSYYFYDTTSEICERYCKKGIFMTNSQDFLKDWSKLINIEKKNVYTVSKYSNNELENWSFLEGFNFFGNTIIIFDNFLISNDLKLDFYNTKNIISAILNSFYENKISETIEIMIISNNKETSNIQELKDYIFEKFSNLDIKFSIISTPKSGSNEKIHDRGIISNYFYFDSPIGLILLNNEDEVQIDTTKLNISTSPIKFLHYISTYLPDIKNKVLKSKNNEFDKKNKFLN